MIAEHGVCTISCNHSVACLDPPVPDFKNVNCLVTFQSEGVVDGITSYFVVKVELENKDQVLFSKYPSLLPLQHEWNTERVCQRCSTPKVRFPYLVRGLFQQCCALAKRCIDNDQPVSVKFFQNATRNWFVGETSSAELISTPRLNSQFPKSILRYITPAAREKNGDRLIDTTFLSEELGLATNIVCMLSDKTTLCVVKSGGMYLFGNTTSCNFNLFLPDIKGSSTTQKFDKNTNMSQNTVSTKSCRTIATFASFYSTCRVSVIPKDHNGGTLSIFSFKNFLRTRIAQSDLRWIPKNKSKKVSKIVCVGIIQ